MSLEQSDEIEKRLTLPAISGLGDTGKTICLLGASAVLIGLSVCGFRLNPGTEAYQSSASVLVEGLLPAQPGLKAPPFKLNLQSGISEINPYKTQVALLQSQAIQNRVFDRLRQQKLSVPVQSSRELRERFLWAEWVPGTGLLHLYARANQPATAQKLGQLYLDAYLALSHEIVGPSVLPEPLATYHQEAFKVASEPEHAEIQTAVAPAEKTNQATENLQKWQAWFQLEAQRQALQVNLAQKRAEVARLRQQLKIGPHGLASALQAVAKGHDAALIRLQQKLQEAQKEYDLKALIYAPTNPDMIALHKKIVILQRQAMDEQILTIGDVPNSSPIMIKDAVRTGLVNRLASEDVESAALQRRLRQLDYQAQTLKKSLQNAPSGIVAQPASNPVAHAKASKSEKPLSVHSKAHEEAPLPEQSMRPRWVVIDPPDLPQKPQWPSFLWRQALLMLCFAVGAFGMVWGGFRAFTQNYLTPERVEQDLEIPVLGQLPSIPERKWRYYRQHRRLEAASQQTSPELLKAYQDVALNLKVQRRHSQHSLLVFTSLLEGERIAPTLANLALCLAQSGERVLVVDANLRHPALHEAFNQELDYERGLPELVNSVSELLHRKKEAQVEDVMRLVNASVSPSGLHPQLEYLNAGVTLENTFDFLNDKSFEILLNVLKTGYDRVLVSASPLLAHPDAILLQGCVDGLLLLAERGTKASCLRLAWQKVNRAGAQVDGVILSA